MTFPDHSYHQYEIEPHWYALHTKYRHEKKVDIRLKEKRIPSYLPLASVYRQWSDRHKRIEEPLFSCYVFVLIPLRERLAVVQTDGAVNLVSFNGVPAAIPEAQIEAIRQVLERNVEVVRADYFTPGERVRVVRGPLHNVEGTLFVQKNNSRLVIRVQGIHQAISVEIDPHDLEAVGEARATL